LMIDQPFGTVVPVAIAISAHLFVFYFGIIADITPPVALAAFAASGISGGEPIRTGVIAAKLAAAAFIIPYMFVLSPSLLMIDTTWPQLIWVVGTAFAGMIAIGAGLIGYWYRKLNWFERVITFAAGIALIYPEGIYSYIGGVVFIVLFVLQWMKREKKVPRTSEA
jgi:TRAP-type uncharacterized transport system fused permease subunit